ncbi:hypothetical protein DSC_09415 [Pseudoxanthomonas spadix BD-a59]|jgi:hypothetical protein|uniref:Uncharacterized protein n=1 Tax=Pseudoxanthomonas spadix (strain BD-a59) TaxID=1045855 RepID=G7UWM4_PSEUP|nr:hypothetical protein DSC_09415 [Pseudoxanthomonas spadix BD-a59]ART38381.1 G433 [uncultured bacterium]
MECTGRRLLARAIAGGTVHRPARQLTSLNSAGDSFIIKY